MGIQSPGKVVKLSYKSHGHKLSLGFSSRSHFAFLYQTILCESFHCPMVDPVLFITVCSTFLKSLLASFPAVFFCVSQES